MACYLYIGVDKNDKLVGGSLNYKKREKVDIYIKKLELLEVEVFSSETTNLYGLKSINERDISVFCKEMHILLKTNHTLVESLVIVSDKIKNKNIQKALVELYGFVNNEGIIFADAILMYEHIFGKYLISLIIACQETEGLYEVFNELSIYFEKSYNIRTKLRQMVIYPMSLLIVMAFVIYMFNETILPLFKEMIPNNSADEFIDLLININTFFDTYAKILLGSFCLFFIIFFIYNKTKQGKLYIGKIMTFIPFYSKVLKYSESYKFTHAMAIMMKNGLPLKYSYEQAVFAVENTYLQKSLLAAYNDILRGQSYSDSVANVGIYPKEYLHLLDLGEKSNALPDILEDVTNVLENDVRNSIDRFVSFSEPVVAVVLTSIVIFIFLNIMIPIVELINTL
ncbi:MAG: type II secretion system F family protein [Lachnospirales bacterium]